MASLAAAKPSCGPNPWQTAADTATDFPCFPYVINAARKTLQTEKQAIQHSIYVFRIAHFKRWFTSALGHLDCSFQQSFTTGKKARRIKIRDKTFWTCFRQDLNLNFQSPSFSAVFPPFSAVVCPLNFRFFMFFPVYLCSFHDSKFDCIQFRCRLERCCKCQTVTNNSSETALCEQCHSCRTYALQF